MRVPVNFQRNFSFFWYVCWMCALLRLTLCDPMDCSSPGSSVHGILQARILEWVAISSSKGSLWLNIIKAIILTSLLLNPLEILRGMGCKTREVLLEESWEDLSHIYGVILSSTQKAGIQGPFVVEGMKAPCDKDWWWPKRMSQFFKRCSLDRDMVTPFLLPPIRAHPPPRGVHLHWVSLAQEKGGLSTISITVKAAIQWTSNTSCRRTQSVREQLRVTQWGLGPSSIHVAKQY